MQSLLTHLALPIGRGGHIDVGFLDQHYVRCIFVFLTPAILPRDKLEANWYEMK
jgi:hypothetical protein